MQYILSYYFSWFIPVIWIRNFAHQLSTYVISGITIHPYSQMWIVLFFSYLFGLNRRPRRPICLCIHFMFASSMLSCITLRILYILFILFLLLFIYNYSFKWLNQLREAAIICNRTMCRPFKLQQIHYKTKRSQIETMSDA